MSTLPINQVLLGDAIEVLKSLPDNSIDCLISDPPYAKTLCDWDKSIDWAAFWVECKRVLQEKGSVVMTAAQPFTTDLISSNRKWFKYCMVWDKGCPSNFAACKYRPISFHEDIVVFAGKTHLFVPQKTFVGKASTGHRKGYVGKGSKICFNTDAPRLQPTALDRYPRSIIQINSQSAECNNTRRLHPTQKPLELFRYLISSYTHPGMTVLDPFLGSGTTAIACLGTDRQFIGVEKDPGYHAIALSRIARSLEVAA